MTAFADSLPGEKHRAGSHTVGITGVGQGRPAEVVEHDGEASTVSPGRFEADTSASKSSDGHDGELRESNKR